MFSSHFKLLRKGKGGEEFHKYSPQTVVNDLYLDDYQINSNLNASTQHE